MTTVTTVPCLDHKSRKPAGGLWRYPAAIRWREAGNEVKMIENERKLQVFYRFLFNFGQLDHEERA